MTDREHFVTDERGLVLALLMLALVLVGVVVWFGPGSALGPIARPLIVDQTPRKADAIVVLLGGETPSRVLKAYELYKDGLAPRIAFGTGYVDRDALRKAPAGLNWPFSGERYMVALESLGVSKGSLSLIDTSHDFDTAHELATICAQAAQNNWGTLIFVSSPAHTRRVDLISKRVAPFIQRYVVASDEPEIHTWWSSGHARREVAYEYLALIKEGWAQVYDLIFKRIFDKGGAKPQDTADDSADKDEGEKPSPPAKTPRGPEQSEPKLHTNAGHY